MDVSTLNNHTIFELKPYGIPISPKLEPDFDREKVLKKLKISG